MRFSPSHFAQVVAQNQPTMSDKPNTTVSNTKTGKQPVHEAASASNPHTQHEGEDNTRGPAHLPINPNANLEAQFERTYHEMLDLSDEGKQKEAEKVAYILLSFGNLPVLYRAFAHMVCVCTCTDCEARS